MRLDYISLSSSDSSTASLSLSLANQGFLHSKALYGLFVGNDITGQHVGEVTSTEKERENQKASHRSHLRRDGRFGQVRPKHTDLENNLTQPYSHTDMLDTYSSDSNEVFDDYLCANANVRRRPKTLIPEEKKDDDYWRRRRKNNLAAKKSREAKKQKNEDLFQRTAVLREEHDRLM